MEERICMITGANSGIGKATATELARKGARVIMVCRDEEKGKKVQQEIVEKTSNSQVDLLIADFSSQESIRNMVKEFKSNYDQLHVLVNNAGTMQSKRRETEDGLEKTFGVNHIGPFLLTNLLLDVIKASAPSRIINVSSGLHVSSKIDFDDLQSVKSYSGMKAYSMSKLANVLFTYELHHQLRDEGVDDVTVNAVHPGFVRTNLGREGGNFLVKYVFSYLIRPFITISPEKGAETSIYLASSPEVEHISGKYFVKKQETPSADFTYDRELQKRLWRTSEELTGLKR
ncbi:MAG: SDR family oxidoreductase [Candidatus Odinarchaeota archaeon]